MGNSDKFKEISRFETDLNRCVLCGFCTFFCPVYREELVESSLARGKIMMIRALIRGELEFSKEFSERLNTCLLCMACTAKCPAGAQVPPAILAARADRVRAKGLPFWKGLILRYLLPHRRLFGNTVKVASKFQGIFMPRAEGSIRHLAFFLSALGKGRRIPEIAGKFLRQQVPVVAKPPVGVETKMRVGYFIGCANDFIFPQVGKKTINFLNKNGVEVIIPKEQGCCGAPVWFGAGDFETGRKMADKILKVFQDVDIIVTDCATCSSALKEYPKFLADTPERMDSYSKFSAKVKDISEFLVDVLKLPASAYRASAQAKGLKVTWHDPCHLNRYQGLNKQPRQIIQSIPGIEFVEMPNADRCCGMAGTFSVDYYGLSKKITDQKIEGIRATGADVVVTECPGCMIQLIDNLARHEMPQKVMNLMELLE